MPAKVQRVSEEEVKRIWKALDLEQRKEITRFDDAALVNCIRSAVNSILAKQIGIERAGQRPSGLGTPDFFVDSILMKEVFDLPWNTYTSDEFPDAVLMDMDDQVPVMSVRPSILEGDLIFDRFSQILPDFLGLHVKRLPVHRARWKKLWEGTPSTVPALEQQLAQLMEQAFWGMGSNPGFAAVHAHGQPVNDIAASCSNEVPFEGWMASSPREIVGQSAAKGNKKRHKKKSGKSSEADATCSLGLAISSKEPADSEHFEDAEVAGSAYSNGQQSDCHMNVVMSSSAHTSQFVGEVKSNGSRDGPLVRRSAGRGAESVSVTNDAPHPSSSSISRPVTSRTLAESEVLCNRTGGASTTPSNAAVGDACENTRSADFSIQSGEHLAEQRSAVPKIYVEDDAGSCSSVPNQMESQATEPEPEHFSGSDCDPRSRLREPMLETAIIETPVVHDHYWGQQEHQHWTRPSLQWCLPSGIWRRGRWARARQDEPLASGTPIICVQNTFINLEENFDSEQGTRLTRSLSPAHIRGVQAEGDWRGGH